MRNEIVFFLQDGTHFILPNSFTPSKPDFFRRSLSKIIKPFANLKVDIVIKTSSFFIFVSDLLSMENINFFGNDISLNQTTNLNFCSSNTHFVCCSDRNFYTYKSHPCYLLDSQNLFSSGNQELKGLFNIEKIFK